MLSGVRFHCTLYLLDLYNNNYYYYQWFILEAPCVSVPSEEGTEGVPAMVEGSANIPSTEIPTVASESANEVSQKEPLVDDQDPSCSKDSQETIENSGTTHSYRGTTHSYRGATHIYREATPG